MVGQLKSVAEFYRGGAEQRRKGFSESFSRTIIPCDGISTGSFAEFSSDPYPQVPAQSLRFSASPRLRGLIRSPIRKLRRNFCK